MANHHAINERRELPKDRELFRVQLGTRAFDLRKIVMRIHRCSRVAGKMFAATQDALPAHGIVKGARQPDDLFHALAVAAAPERIVRVIVEGNVEDWAEIEIESE